MQLLKNKYISIFLTFFIISIIIPFYSYANEEVSFVWSDISTPSIETVSSLTEGKRQFS